MKNFTEQFSPLLESLSPTVTQFCSAVLTIWEDVVPQSPLLNLTGGDRTQGLSHQTDDFSKAPQSELCPPPIGHGYSCTGP